MKRSYQALEKRRQFVSGKTIIGIDPAKRKHQAVILDANGIQMGRSFSFAVTFEGYHQQLWQKLQQYLPDHHSRELLFAVETACNLWATLAFYLWSQGHTVVLVSPLATHHSRPIMNHDFSRTDPKDAILVASLARDGYFNPYRALPGNTSALRQLAITYDKLRKELQQNQGRLRGLLERLFPEFLEVLQLDTDSARYLLSKYLLPQDYLHLDLQREGAALERVSQKQHGLETLKRLQEAARSTIGITRDPTEAVADRISAQSWLALINTLRDQMKQVSHQLIQLAGESPYFPCLTSLKGVSELTAALFLAETYNLAGTTHYQQVEKLAGLNLRLSQSGQSRGYRKLSKIGNRRLRWLLYRMTEEAVKYIPEVRTKYLKRQLKRRSYRKNLLAATPRLLQLILALAKEKRTYQLRPESQKRLAELEAQDTGLKSKKTTARTRKAA